MLETSRLYLRPMREDDVEALLRVFTDPRVMASFGIAPFDRTRMERWVRRNLDHQERYGYGLFSVLLRENGLLIGDCGIEHMDVGGEIEAELGYDLCSDYWNRGLATEAAEAVRDYAFGVLGLSRLISLIGRGNEASRRVAEKLGMSLAGELERDGQAYWLYAVSREEAAQDRVSGHVRRLGDAHASMHGDE